MLQIPRLSELAIIAVVALLIFGGSQRLPKLMKDLGTGFKAFKEGASPKQPSENNASEHPQKENT